MLICTDYNKAYAEILDTDDFVIERVSERDQFRAYEMGLTIQGLKPCGSILIPSPARDLLKLLESSWNVIERPSFVIGLKHIAGKQYPSIFLWFNGFCYEIEARGTERESEVLVNGWRVTRSLNFLFNTLGIFCLHRDGTFYIELLGGTKYNGDVYKLVFDGQGNLKTQNGVMVNIKLGNPMSKEVFKQCLFGGGM